MTETVDETVSEQKLTSGFEPSKLGLKLNGAGVYILKVEGRDSLGRTQSVAVDFFADGGTPVTWSRPPAQVFKVTTEKPDYKGGDTAVLILESPFQNAEALAIVEEPDARMRYEWVHVRNGVGRFALQIDPDLYAAHSGAFPADARPLAGCAADGGSARSRAAANHGRHQLDRGEAGQEHRRCEARLSGKGGCPARRSP